MKFYAKILQNSQKPLAITEEMVYNIAQEKQRGGACHSETPHILF